jgi:hypothetical protein
MSDPDATYCNARLKGHDGLEKREPGEEWAGEGYCRRQCAQRRCKDHGGNGGRPITNGLYSFRRGNLREKLNQALDQDTPGDLWSEVAVLRTLLSDFLERVEQVDADTIKGATAEIRKTVDTINEMMNRSRPTEEEVNQLVNSFASIIRDHVPEGQRDDALDELERTVGGREPRALESGGD